MTSIEWTYQTDNFAIGRHGFNVFHINRSMLIYWAELVTPDDSFCVGKADTLDDAKALCEASIVQPEVR